jgi:nucleoside phosphorylase
MGPRADDWPRVAPRPADVTIGIITALPVEYAGVRALLVQPTRTTVSGDSNNHEIAWVPSAEPELAHTVALTMLPQDGTRTAAATCADVVRSFPRIRCVVTCGIAGGVPAAGAAPPLRLGDVVVATTFVDYGHVRSVDGHDELRRPPPRGPSYDLLRAANELRAKAARGDQPWQVWLRTPDGGELRGHPRGDAGGERRGGGGHRRPEVHYGPVASGDRLLRDAQERDRLAVAYRVLAVEMEASGIAVAAALRNVDWFMIRGIADYCDGAKDDTWHAYAASTAAAYLRALLAECRPYASAQSPGPPSLQTRHRLVTLLLDIPAVAQVDSRQSVIGHLPPTIRDSVRRHPITRVEVLNLIGTCFDYPGGLRSLVDAIGLVGGDSPALQRFVAALERELG